MTVFAVNSRYQAEGALCHHTAPGKATLRLMAGGTAAVGRKCGRNVGPWVYTVGVPDVKMEISEKAGK